MKKLTSQDKITPELPGIILLSHGPMALAMLDSAALLVGEVENLTALSVEEGDDPFAFGNLFVEAVGEFSAGALVMIDLYGGTPFNQAVYRCQKDSLNATMLTGLSLPMLVDAVALRSEDLVSWGNSVYESALLGTKNLAQKDS